MAPNTPSAVHLEVQQCLIGGIISRIFPQDFLPSLIHVTCEKNKTLSLSLQSHTTQPPDSQVGLNHPGNPVRLPENYEMGQGGCVPS